MNNETNDLKEQTLYEVLVELNDKVLIIEDLYYLSKEMINSFIADETIKSPELDSSTKEKKQTALINNTITSEIHLANEKLDTLADGIRTNMKQMIKWIK